MGKIPVLENLTHMTQMVEKNSTSALAMLAAFGISANKGWEPARWIIYDTHLLDVTYIIHLLELACQVKIFLGAIYSPGIVGETPAACGFGDMRFPKYYPNKISYLIKVQSGCSLLKFPYSSVTISFGCLIQENLKIFSQQLYLP